MAINFDPATVRVLADRENHGSIHFDTTDARYHVWINFEPLGLAIPTLYKNPPLGVDRNDPDFFDCRKLDPNAAANKCVVEELIAIVKEGDFVAKAVAEREAREKVKADRAEARQRLHHVRELGPQLLDVARALLAAGTFRSDIIDTREAFALIRLADAPLDQRVKVTLRPKASPDRAADSRYAANERAAVESYVANVHGSSLDLLPEDVEVLSVEPIAS